MKTIKFGVNEYNLVYDPVVSASLIRATIYKGDNDIIDVAEAANNQPVIQVLEDGVVVKVFNGFTQLVTIQLFDNYPVNGEITDSVYSIELQNVSIQSQLDSIVSNVATIEEGQIVQDAAIADLGQAVSDLEPIE